MVGWVSEGGGRDFSTKRALFRDLQIQILLQMGGRVTAWDVFS